MIAETNGEPKLKLPKRELVSEHKDLVRVLRRGSKGELRKEAREQSKELKQYRAAKTRKPSRSGSR